MNFAVQYLSSPVALRMVFSEIPYPMRLQSAVYPTGEEAQRAISGLQAGVASVSGGLYCFVQVGDEEQTFYVGAYGADTAHEKEAWRWVTGVLTSGRTGHMAPPRVMRTLQSAWAAGTPAPSIARA